ncbi:hypothetical protein PYW08_011366 [Mythimna loreyi]|uniref:Uncharacterized protein n=1 Tax=Mythimna loreyi TaxID=667449 RepID=A0ACC2Q3Y5_9NEOP|nr:hypothetical protein PYW08_011366 [Mythimna loreyi]
MKFLPVVATLTLVYQMAVSQMLRPPPYNLINRPLGDKIIETSNFINTPTPTVISEPPSNSIVPIPTVVPTPSTTIITDCSPEICQNLANTIQLMIVANLLQNQNVELGRQLATPVLNEIMSSPILSCGCSNPLSPNLISSSIIAPSVAGPNFAPNLINNFIPNNIVPNIYSPNFVAPTPSVVAPSMLPLPPRVVAPNAPCPNAPQVGPANVNGLLNTIMGMLGNLQG